MAERRMFAKTIIDSDAFLDMPLSTQALYFHLSMRADDEGFNNNPKRIMRMIGASDDDMRLLIAKAFIICFDTGIVVIKHWRIHNYIQKDRFKATAYTFERSQLSLAEGGAYEMDGYRLDTDCIQDGYRLDTQDSIGKDSIGKVSVSVSDSKKRSRAQATRPTIDEISAYCQERQNGIDPQRFFDYYSAQGWKLSNGNPMKDWKAAVRNWESRDKQHQTANNDGFISTETDWEAIGAMMDEDW